MDILKHTCKRLGFTRGTLALAALLIAMLPVSSEEPSRGQKIKAAYIFNFLRFVQWPAYVLPEGGKLNICVLGPDKFGGALQALEGRQVKGRAITVSFHSEFDQIESCHLLFVSALSKDGLPKVLAAARPLNILSVSDVDDFSSLGGMIQFVSWRNKLRFEINLGAAEKSDLKISSELLRLAKTVVERPEN